MANRVILTGRGEEGGNDVRVVKEMEGAEGKRKPAGSLKNGNRCLLASPHPPPGWIAGGAIAALLKPLTSLSQHDRSV